jgi:hypothetical protein
VSTAAFFSSVMTDTCPGRGRSTVDTRPPRNLTHHLNTVLRFRHVSPYTSFIRRKMSLGDAPSLHRNWMTPHCTCLDASIRRTCCYNFHHYAAHTCRRLTLFCAGTANACHHVATPSTIGIVATCVCVSLEQPLYIQYVYCILDQSNFINIVKTFAKYVHNMNSYWFSNWRLYYIRQMMTQQRGRNM